MSGVLKVKVGGVWTPVSATAGPHHASHEPGGSDALQFTTGILERGRSVPLGEWINIPYAASDFAGVGGVAWTVEASDLLTFSYALVGRVAVVLLNVQASSVGGTAGTTLRVMLPVVPIRYQAALFWGLDNGVRTVIAAEAAPGAAYLNLYRADTANWSPSSNGTYLNGQIILAI